MLLTTWIIAKNDLACYLKKPAAIFWTFLGPALCMWLFGYLTPAASDIAPLTVINHDKGHLAADTIIRNLRRNGHPVLEAATSAATTLSIEIPAGFSGAPSQHAIAIYAPAAETNGERALRYEIAASLIHPVQTRSEAPLPAPGGKFTGGFQRTVPAYLIMFMTMNLLISGAGFSEELASGRLRRLLAAPISRVTIITGRLGSRLVIAWLQMLVLFAIGVFLLHIQWAQHPFGVLAILSLYTLAMGAIGVLFGTLIKDPDQAQAFAMWSTLLIAPLAGLWWPLELMPSVVAKIGSLLPTAWVMRSVSAMLAFPLPLHDFAPTVAGLLLIAAATILLASWRLQPTK